MPLLKGVLNKNLNNCYILEKIYKIDRAIQEVIKLKELRKENLYIKEFLVQEDKVNKTFMPLWNLMGGKQTDVNYLKRIKVLTLYKNNILT